MTKAMERGVSRLGLLFIVLIIAAAVFVGSQVFPYYYNYYEIVGLMEAQAAKASEFTDQEIRHTLLSRIKKLDIPLDDPEELKINRFSGNILIEFEYEEVLEINYGEDKYKELYVFQFHPRVERPLTGPRR